MDYTQEEIREAYRRVEADIKNAYKTQKEIALAVDCQGMVLNYLESIMTEEEEETEEKEEPEEIVE